VRVVLDNNICVSGLWSPDGAPAQILAAIRSGRIRVVMSLTCLLELKDVLGRDHIRRRISQAQAIEFLTLLQQVTEAVPILDTLQICSDPKDDKVVETAIIGRVDFLVSGDHHLHEEAVVNRLREEGIEVIHPTDFVRLHLP
jgi:uncharacterized protein